jgi:O-antigen/teichoic acid export membrane protein
MLIGTAATGSFGVGSIYGTMISVLQNAFNRAYKPYLYRNLKNSNEQTKNKLVRITYLYNSGLFVFSLLVGVVGILVNNLIFGQGYNDSKIFIIWMTLGNAFNGMYKMHINYIFYTKKTYYLLYITLFLGVLNTGLSYWLIGKYGAVAGAQVFLLTQLFGYLLSWYIGNKLIPMPWFKIKLSKHFNQR